jgi:DNA-binding transcriptional regulator GbsR (MarR family)
MKLSKTEIIENIESGYSLVERFDRMYGKYYFLKKESAEIYNLDKRAIQSVKKICVKKFINPNESIYSFK